MFFPQLEINMDRRQSCLIDLSFSCYSFCNISLNPITADLVAAGLRGVTFLFYPLPDSWVWEGFFLYKKKIIYLIIFTRRVSLHIHLYLQAKPAPKVSVNALIKKGIISQRIERETVFWFTCLFVCFYCLLFSPVHIWETICMEQNFSRHKNIRTVILHVNWFVLISKKKKKSVGRKEKKNQKQRVYVEHTLCSMWKHLHSESPGAFKRCIWLERNFEICKVN